MSRIMGFTHDRMVERGHHVDYFHAEDLSRRGALRRFTFPWAVYRHARAMARRGRPYDILNVHEPSAVPSVLGRRFAGHPRVVVTSHGVEQRAWELALEEQRLGRGGPSFKSRIVYPLSSLWQSRLGFRGADHVLCLNEEDREYLSRRFGVDPQRITRIFPGADRIFADVAQARDYAGSARVLFAGTWRKNKGVEDLVPAFRALHRRFPFVALRVLGAGVPEDQVRAAFPDDVRPAVEYVVTRTEAETAQEFARADVFVLPSLFEGTPLTLIEAMASGLPIVTTAVCGMRDVIADGRNGLLVPIRRPDAIADAMARLVESRTLRCTLGSAARRDAGEHYTWEAAADRLLSTYERVLPAAAA